MLSRLEPDFLSLFGIEALLKLEQSKKPILSILKAYLERKEHNTQKQISLVDQIIINESLKQEVMDYVIFHARPSHDSSAENPSLLYASVVS